MCTVAAVAGAAIALFGAKKKNDAAKKAAEAQRKAAELQTKVARELHQHWQTYYQQCDIQAIKDVCAVPVYAANYSGIVSRVSTAALREFGLARARAIECQDTFCVANSDCNFLVGVEAQATVDTMNFGFRREEGVKEQLDQIRLENKRSFLALGRGLLKTSSDAAQLAAKLGAALGGWLGSSKQGWLEFAGYLGSPEGKTFTDDVTKGIRGLFTGAPETPSARASSGTGTTIAYSSAVRAQDGVPQRADSPVPLALPAPTDLGGQLPGGGGNLGNRIGLPPGVLNLTGGAG